MAAPSKIRLSTQVFVDADLAMGTKKITGLGTPSNDTDAATKSYVDGILQAGDAMQYKGVKDCSTNPNYPAADAGHTYKVSVAGKIGGASGHSVYVGDLLVCTADGTAAGTEAAVGSFWDVIHVDAASGTVISSAATPLDNQIVRLDSTTGSLIQNSLATIDDNGSINIPSGQSYKINNTALVTNANHSGDVTGDTALTIAANAVTLAKLATQASDTFLANVTADAAVPTAVTVAEQTLVGRITGGHIDDLSTTQVRTLINVADGATANAKATGAELDTGTDDAKFATAKALVDSHNVPSVAPSTSGNILTSNGTDWTSAAPASQLPTFVTREAPSGTKNGSNPTFTLAHAPTSGSEMLFLNGLLLNVGAGNDYTISTDTITMLVIPVSTDVLLATYRY